MLFAKLADMSKSHLSSLALALTVLAAAPAAVADSATWRFDPVHTQVVFFADHLSFSHGIGRIRIRDGWLRFDADDWSTVELDVVLDLASVDMGDDKWTQTVRSAQFFDTGRWPQARFTSSSAEKTAADRGIVHGTLTLRGISKPVALEVTLNRIGRDPYAFKTKAGFRAHAT